MTSLRTQYCSHTQSLPQDAGNARLKKTEQMLDQRSTFKGAEVSESSNPESREICPETQIQTSGSRRSLRRGRHAAISRVHVGDDLESVLKCDSEAKGNPVNIKQLGGDIRKLLDKGGAALDQADDLINDSEKLLSTENVLNYQDLMTDISKLKVELEGVFVCFKSKVQLLEKAGSDARYGGRQKENMLKIASELKKFVSNHKMRLQERMERLDAISETANNALKEVIKSQLPVVIKELQLFKRAYPKLNDATGTEGGAMIAIAARVRFQALDNIIPRAFLPKDLKKKMASLAHDGVVRMKLEHDAAGDDMCRIEKVMKEGMPNVVGWQLEFDEKVSAMFNAGNKKAVTDKQLKDVMKYVVLGECLPYMKGFPDIQSQLKTVCEKCIKAQGERDKKSGSRRSFSDLALISEKFDAAKTLMSLSKDKELVDDLKSYIFEQIKIAKGHSNDTQSRQIKGAMYDFERKYGKV